MGKLFVSFVVVESSNVVDLVMVMLFFYCCCWFVVVSWLLLLLLLRVVVCLCLLATDKRKTQFNEFFRELEADAKADEQPPTLRLFERKVSVHTLFHQKNFVFPSYSYSFVLHPKTKHPKHNRMAATTLCMARTTPTTSQMNSFKRGTLSSTHT